MVRDVQRRLIEAFPALLARLGLVEREKATAALDLAAPVGFASSCASRTSSWWGWRSATQPSPASNWASSTTSSASASRWLLYGTVVGSYVYRLPVAFLALPAGFGVTIPLVGVTLAPGLGWGLPAIYAAIVGDYYLKVAVNTGRFRTGKWREVARTSRVGTGTD